MNGPWWPLLLKHGAFSLFLFLSLRLTRPAYLAFRRKKSGYGVVFNSATGIPEALVTVSLRDLHGSIVRTTVTDKSGRYRLVAPKGEYYVELSKFGYKFPSAALKNPRRHFVYDNVLPATHIIIRDHGAITKNIPIDPLHSSAVGSFFRLRLNLNKEKQYLIAGMTPLVATLVIFFQQDAIFMWAIAVVYAIFALNRLVSFKPPEPPFGTIRDNQTGRPLDRVVVRIFEAKYNKLLETQVTSPKGRYAFVVGRGTYRVLIKREGYKGVILNFPQVKKDGFLLSRDVRLTKLPRRV